MISDVALFVILLAISLVTLIIGVGWRTGVNFRTSAAQTGLMGIAAVATTHWWPNGIAMLAATISVLIGVLSVLTLWHNGPIRHLSPKD